MKQITTLFIALTMTSTLSAQLIRFQKTYGGAGTDYCWSVAQTTDGGYILGGETNSFGAGSYDAYLTKTDAYGTIQWTRTYGGTGWDRVYMVRQTPDGGYVAVGLTESSGNGLGDIWIFKTNNIGIISWQRTCGSVNGDSGNDIIPTSDGGYAAVGLQNGGVATNDNACLLKLDGSGNIQWVHSYSVGSDDDYGYSVAQTSDGGYIIGGENFNGVNSAALAIKTDASGNVQWANTYGGSNDHWINGIIVQPSGNYMIAGVSSQLSPVNAWLAKLSPNGTPVWSNSYSGPGTSDDNCVGLASTSDGGYALCGRTNSFSADYGAFLIKTDSSGAPEWSKEYGGIGNDQASQVIQSTNSGYVLACSSLSFGNGQSAYVIKTDTNGSSGCNESLPAFLMTAYTLTATSINVIDSSLTNVAASSLSFTSPTLTETSLCFTVGENEFIADDDLISIYPNPATNQITIYDSGFTIESFEVYSSLGEKIYNQNQTGDNQQQKIHIDAHRWSAGIYFIRIKTLKETVIKKLVKQ